MRSSRCFSFRTTQVVQERTIEDGTLKVYEKLSHGMYTTHADIINPDLLTYIKG